MVNVVLAVLSLTILSLVVLSLVIGVGVSKRLNDGVLHVVA